MERNKPEVNEKEKYQPRFMVFLGRHAEAAKGSIFDQVGGEKGIKTDNFEESSLTLKGVVETHLISADMLRSIAERISDGKIKLIFGTTRAYRTKETLEIIRENLIKVAEKLGKNIDIDLPEAKEMPEITEEQDEDVATSRKDIDALVQKVSKEAAKSGDNVVFIGITHEAKIQNFLKSYGIESGRVANSEFFSVSDNNTTDRLTFRGQSVNIPKV